MARTDPHQPRGGAYAARVRAAAAFADLDRVRLGERLGVSRETVSRLFAGKSDPPLETRQRIAEACGVPAWFLESGFEGVEELDDQRQSVGQLASQLREERAARETLAQDVAEMRALLEFLASARILQPGEQVTLDPEFAHLADHPMFREQVVRVADSNASDERTADQRNETRRRALSPHPSLRSRKSLRSADQSDA